MLSSRTMLLPLLAFLIAAPADAQIIDRIRRKVDEAQKVMEDARALRCDVQGVCGEVWQSDMFAPESYESLAVTIFDATRRYRAASMQSMVRDAFEGALIEGGFLLAASSDADEVRARIARGQDQWTDEELAQLRDFVNNIDAVLVLEIQQLQLGRCQLEERRYGTQATVHLTARWLNTDAGDIPWAARHKAAVCEDGGAAALAAALETAASQLATTLPRLSGGN